MEHEPAADIGQLTEAMDHETMVWSGGFERSAHYQAIADAGPSALPQLIAELDAGAFWVSRCELVAEIAQSAGLALTFPDEAAQWSAADGVAYIVKWGQQQGLYEPVVE